jgi:hypothetical protein
MPYFTAINDLQDVRDCMRGYALSHWQHNKTTVAFC